MSSPDELDEAGVRALLEKEPSGRALMAIIDGLPDVLKQALAPLRKDIRDLKKRVHMLERLAKANGALIRVEHCHENVPMEKVVMYGDDDRIEKIVERKRA